MVWLKKKISLSCINSILPILTTLSLIKKSHYIYLAFFLAKHQVLGYDQYNVRELQHDVIAMRLLIRFIFLRLTIVILRFDV